MDVASYKAALARAVEEYERVNRDRARLEQRAKVLEETIGGLRRLIASTDVIVLNFSRRPLADTVSAATPPRSTPPGGPIDFREVVVRALSDARTIQRPETQALMDDCERAARRFHDDHANRPS